MSTTTKTRTAVEAFVAAKLEFDAILARLANQSADHFGADPGALNWGDVGSLNRMLELLRRVEHDD